MFRNFFALPLLFLAAAAAVPDAQKRDDGVRLDVDSLVSAATGGGLVPTGIVLTGVITETPIISGHLTTITTSIGSNGIGVVTSFSGDGITIGGNGSPSSSASSDASASAATSPAASGSSSAASPLGPSPMTKPFVAGILAVITGSLLGAFAI